MNRRRIAWILILVVDAGYVVWGAGAAIAPEGLPGPRGLAILPAAYQGFTGSSWAALVTSSPMTAVRRGGQRPRPFSGPRNPGQVETPLSEPKGPFEPP